MISSLTSILWATSGILGLLVIVFYLKYLKAPIHGPGEPPLIPYVWPFLGHTAEFLKDQRAFYAKASARSNGNPFTLFFINRKAYVFSKPKDTEIIYGMFNNRNHSQDDVKQFRTNILGFESKDADKIAAFRVEENKIHTKFLLNSEQMTQITSIFNEELDRQLLAITNQVRDTDNSVAYKDGFSFVGDVLIQATLRAFFGDLAFAAYPRLFQDFRTFFTVNFGYRFWGVPLVFDKSPLEARERIKSRLRAVITSVLETGSSSALSEYNMNKVVKTREAGLSIEGVISNEFDLIIAGNINTIPIAYIALLHLYDDPSLLAEIREELGASSRRLSSARQRAYLDPKQLPKLLALFQEVLRFHATNLSIRELKQDMIVTIPPKDKDDIDRTYELKKGRSLPGKLSWFVGNNMIFIPSSLLHHNPDIHENPDIFDAKRFLSVEHGGKGTPATSAKLRAFGGGSSYCPGRLFAEQQVVSFLAAVCLKFDIVIDSKGWEMPQNADFTFVASLPDIRLKLLNREVDQVV